MFNGPVNTKGFVSSPFQSLIKYNNPLHICLPLLRPPAGCEETRTVALYSEKEIRYRENGLAIEGLAIGKWGLHIGAWIFSLLPSQFLAPKRAGLCTKLSVLNLDIIYKCRQHLPRGFNRRVIYNRNITC